MRLMIVDDHLGVRQLIRQFVATAQDTVCECASGDEAIRVAPGFKPDAVTMDVRMPGSCGLAATRAIRAALPDTRVIIVTSHDQPDLGCAAREAGAVGFVLKDNLADLSKLLRTSAQREPVTESNPAETPATSAAKAAGSVTGKPHALLVLMVDSCANDSELVSARLAASGFKPIIERVHSRETFQRALDHGRWDLILTEQNLPMISGAEVIGTVRERSLPVPVICLTGSFRPAHVDAMLQAGAAACVDKNFLQDLGEVVRQTLHSATGFDPQE